MTMLAPSPTLDLVSRKQEIQDAHDTAITNLIECGRLLVDTQRQLDEQTFIAFCDTLKFSRSTAYNYMKLYEHSLVQRLDTLQHAMINMSVWYLVDPQDSETTNKIVELANSGKKVTKELARQYAQERAPLNETLMQAAESRPQETVDMLMRGTALNIDGHDVPLIDADPTLIEINVNEDEYEKWQRQKTYIENKAKKKIKLECELELITDRNGVVYLALPQNVSLKLIDRKFTVWYEEETEMEAISA